MSSCTCRICTQTTAVDPARIGATAAASVSQSISMVAPGGPYFDQSCFSGRAPEDVKPATRESHIPNEVIGLRVTVDALVVEVDALCARLTNVTSPLPGVKSDGSDAPDTYRVPLANEIRCERRRVQGVIDLVRQLSTHLEL